MKYITTIAALITSATLVANSAEKLQTGPKGGRLLEKTEPKAEFFIEKDRTATITFYDEKSKPTSAGDQSVTMIALVKERQVVEFEKKGTVLVSKSKLPAGDPYPVIVQFRQSPDVRPQNYRFTLDLSTCGGCKHAEYACTCHD